MRIDAQSFEALPSLDDALRAVMARACNCATLASPAPERAQWR